MKYDYVLGVFNPGPKTNHRGWVVGVTPDGDLHVGSGLTLEQALFETLRQLNDHLCNVSGNSHVAFPESLRTVSFDGQSAGEFIEPDPK